MNQNILYFREALSHSRAEGRVCVGDTMIVSFFRPDGCYTTEYIKYESMEQLAAIIYADDYDKLFCNSSDYAVFCTEGKRLDSCVSGLEERFIAELMEAVEKTGQK